MISQICAVISCVLFLCRIGGWSAGYYNSVGTKEGWVPTQFISRKNDRSKRRDYKPEDFMDNEDFGEFGIAPRQVKAKEEFFSTTQSFAGFRENIDRQASTIDDVIKDVISLKSTSIGVRILKRMKRNAIQRLSKDGYMNADQIFPLEFDENDLKSFFLNPKKNLNGLGYKGLTTNVNFSSDARLEQTKSEFSTLMKDGKKLKISGEAFGYGALNDDEDDGYEAEIYTFDDLSKYDYTIGGNKQSKSGNLLSSILSDSHLMDDFRKSDEHVLDKINRNVIKVPSMWTPRPPIRTTANKKRKSRWESNEEEDKPKLDESRKYRKLDAAKRAEILGESASSLEREAIELKLKQVKEEQHVKSTSEEPKQEETADRLKKPLIGYFAQKFTQSTNTPLDDYKPGLTKIENLPQTTKSKSEPKEETKSFVGQSNREIYQFHPHKLVCKRFNVPHPYPQYPDVVGVLAMNKSKPNPDSFFPQPTQSTSRSQKVEPVAKKETVPEVIEEFKKPDMNLFKAVFDLSDDDGDLSDIEEIEETVEPMNDAKPIEVNQTVLSKVNPIDLNKEDQKDSISNQTGNEPPRIVFNKAFVKKETSKESKPELAVTKKNVKMSLNLFENEDLGSDEEGLNLLELKKSRKDDEHESFKTIKRKLNKDELRIKAKEEQVDDDPVRRETIDLTVTNKDDLSVTNKDESKDDRSDEDDFVDDFVNEIMKSETSNSHSSSHKKKKKRKEHKKHKKKKHKSGRRSD